MKNIYIFIFLVSIFFSFFLSPPAGADSPPLPEAGNFPYAFSVSSSFGFLYGQGEEILYKHSGQDVYASQLLWDIKPVFYAGISLDFSRINPLEGVGFFTELLLKFGFPMESGIMEDRDWLAPGQDYLTNFSSHANYTGNMIMMDAGAGVSFPLFSLFLVKPYLGFSYQYFKWTARDGYIQYPKGPDGTYLDNAPWNESLEKDPFYGPVASYAQNWFVFAPGLSLGLSLFRYLFLEFHFSLGPVLSCITMDDHFNARHENQDYLSGGIFMEPGGKIVFSPNKKIEIALFAAYRFVSGSRGSSYTRFTGVEGAYRVSGTFTENGYEGGAGFSFLDGGISLKIRF